MSSFRLQRAFKTGVILSSLLTPTQPSSQTSALEEHTITYKPNQRPYSSSDQSSTIYPRRSGTHRASPTHPTMAPVTRSMSRQNVTNSAAAPSIRTTKVSSPRKANATKVTKRSKVRKPKIHSPQPEKLTALEESNAQYEAFLSFRKKEKAIQALPNCLICVEAFSMSKTESSLPYSCPNEHCTVYFCLDCKRRQLVHDYRCPFCRCELDGAEIKRPTWPWAAPETPVPRTTPVVESRPRHQWSYLRHLLRHAADVLLNEVENARAR